VWQKLRLRRGKGMNKRLIALTFAGALAGFGAGSAEACTSLIFKAEDGTHIYARTMEWGASDLSNPR
jgi:choloylglycine hydrolase